jgi:hypothetical protein
MLILVFFASSLIVALLSAAVKNQPVLKFWQLVIKNFLATLTVPLFLGISDSSLLDSESIIDSNGIIVVGTYLKLLGLLIIAAIYSDGFLHQVSEKVMAGIEATENKLNKQQEQLAEQGTAIDETKRLFVTSEIVTTDQEHIPELIAQFRLHDEKVLLLFDPKSSLNSSKYKTIEQLTTKELGASVVSESLNSLKEIGLVDEVSKYNAWYLTANGKEILNFIRNNHSE